MEMQTTHLGNYCRTRVSLPCFRNPPLQETGMLLVNCIHVPGPQGATVHREEAGA